VPVFAKNAGRAADLIFRQGRDAWRKQIRLPLAVVIGGCLIAAIPIRLFFPHGSFFAGVMVGGVVAVAIWVWDDPPNYIERWRQGRDGERWTARELRKLRREGWSARHDLADRYGNIDHVVVGSGGVFLLDSKNLSGAVGVENGVLTSHLANAPRSDYSMPHLPRTLSAAARAVERRLQTELGWIVDVRPIVVLWSNFAQGVAVVDGVPVVRGDLLAEWLRSQSRRIAEVDAPAVRSAVATLPLASA